MHRDQQRSQRTRRWNSHSCRSPPTTRDMSTSCHVSPSTTMRVTFRPIEGKTVDPGTKHWTPTRPRREGRTTQSSKTACDAQSPLSSNWRPQGTIRVRRWIRHSCGIWSWGGRGRRRWMRRRRLAGGPSLSGTGRLRAGTPRGRKGTVLKANSND